ncbi:MAG: hypothetical protein P4M11_13795 [Candidatus Pacebacteria bacterium]|nr:hypothetical protein [Candidatus Paceibacterota bacterium]
MPADIKWHMIGHLQTNKVKKLLTIPNLHLVETVDSMRLARSINGQCEAMDRVQSILVEILTSDEGSMLSGVHVGSQNWDPDQGRARADRLRY